MHYFIKDNKLHRSSVQSAVRPVQDESCGIRFRIMLNSVSTACIDGRKTTRKNKKAAGSQKGKNIKESQGLTENHPFTFMVKVHFL